MTPSAEDFAAVSRLRGIKPETETTDERGFDRFRGVTSPGLAEALEREGHR